MKEITFTRKELYDLVWSEPLIRLSKKFKISDNGLRKICKRMNIPLPTAGHWQKIKSGYKVQVTKLPAKFEGNNTIKLILRNKDGSYVEPEPSQRSLIKKEILNDPKLIMKVPERLSNPDPLVLQAKETLLIEKRKSPHFDGVLETKPGELYIRVAPSNVARSLRFMDAFIKLLIARNHNVHLQYGKIKCAINGIDFEFSLKEKMKIVKPKENFIKNEFHPSGKLAFIVDTNPQKEWKDTSELIENKLLDILIYLEIKSSEVKAWKLEYERKRKIIEAEEQKANEPFIRKQTELTSFANLFKQAVHWQQTKFMRDYLTLVIQNGRTTLNGNAEFQEWIDWAKKKIDWYDPFIQAKDDILNDADRQKLIEIFNSYK
ncbi:hypothetical protein [Maribellus mangrovi]|uniref:hypothetical protein n=1 Tax=Maribellus mangrovi TaxID=3133146 RepID=UPI0030EE48C0